MSSEWKRTTWTFSPVTLSHTYQHIINAIDAMLLATGWARASWSNGGALGADNYYLRTDRYRLDLQHKKWGTSGNQTITVTGAAMTKANLAGGAFGADASTKAAGYVAFSAQPSEGDTVTITDGVVSKTFEFDSDGAVTSGNVQVAIGSCIENSIENLWSVINGLTGFNVVSTPHWHWWYTGDNYYQHNGLRVRYNASMVDIASFLENSTKTGSQIATTGTRVVSIVYDITQDNNFLFVMGEDGFYVEGGTGLLRNNIAHGMVFAYYPDETLGGTRDRERTWTSQGAVYELRGLLVASRSYRFVETVGDRRNHSMYINAQVARGSNDTLNRSIVDSRIMYFGPRDNYFTQFYTTSYHEGSYACLGLIQSNFDDLYRVSLLVTLQGRQTYDIFRSSSGNEVVGGTTDSNTYAYDTRNSLRAIPKFGVCSSYLLPWNNITDKRTGVIFRVAQVSDGGRNSNLCVVWPDNSNVVVTAATP